MQPLLPDLPPAPDGLDSSDGCEAEKEEAKRPQSTSTTPRSGSARGLEPYGCDRLMGVPSVGSTFEEIGDGERTEIEENDFVSAMIPLRILVCPLVLGKARGE